eukprot:GHRR01006198.1.p1 GENE.GHRR01006198.1~~GHRR01006198.1.p1  ORF type:complete len:616 (+),score=203.76 GHRR01006198.1:1123-2970(+)
MLPTGLPTPITDGTSIGLDCSSLFASPSPSPVPDATVPSPSPVPTSPSPEPTTPTDGTSTPTVPPNVTTTDGSTPVSPAPSPSPSPSPTVISNAPVCSCALKGFGSDDCAAALSNVCSNGSPPTVCASGNPANDANAAKDLGPYLADTCFTGQDMDSSICTCVQNLLGNDCAKARVNLCVKGDLLCVPFQNIIDANGSSSAEAVSQVAPVLDQQCTMQEPTVPGVKTTMEFPDLSIGQYITQQYSQNVANALASVTNVPSTSVTAIDVRPFLGSSSSSGRRRLAQAAGNGVQATYFMASNDPSAVSARLSQAANDGILSNRLSQYGISAKAGGLKVQSFLPASDNGLNPVTPSSGSSFPLWSLAIIIPGALAVIGLATWGALRYKRRSSDTSAEHYAPSFSKAAADADYDLPKSYDYNPAPLGTGSFSSNGGKSIGATAAAGAAAAALPAKSTPFRSKTPEDLPVSKSVKVTIPDHAPLTSPASDISNIALPLKDAAATANPSALPAILTPVRTSVGGVPVAGSASRPTDSTAATTWRSNVRPATGQLPSTGGATSSMANPAKTTQQAERAKFWAQFQETWQQVRQNKQLNEEPGTPSSGTNWTDNTGQISPKKH